MKRKLALIGFGTVGQGLCEILIDKKRYLKRFHDFDWEVVAICDTLNGSVLSQESLDVKKLLHLVKNNISLEEIDAKGKLKKGLDAFQTIRESNADIICELTYTNIKTGQPAIDHCITALELGKHVVTSNKGPAALRYNELNELARQKGERFLIEGTVMSGTPVLNLVRNELVGNKISAMQGILNGTTNFILTNMESGHSYKSILKEAQEWGYAEADPTADVEGLDTLAKITILANVIFGENLKPDQIPCKGITQITHEDIKQAQQEKKRWKLIGEIIKNKKGIIASVKPKKVDLSHPLASVMGVANAITFTTDLLGDVTIMGAGAGRKETGFSILSDILEIYKNF